jgi:hypothetical protein
MFLLLLTRMATSGVGCSDARIVRTTAGLTVTGCVFENLSGSGVTQGGAICITGVTAQNDTTISASAFVRCAVYGVYSYGGALYFDVQVQLKVTYCCAVRCSSSKYGQFIHLQNLRGTETGHMSTLTQNTARLCGLPNASPAERGAFSFDGTGSEFSYFNFSHSLVTGAGAAIDIIAGEETQKFSRVVVWNCSGASAVYSAADKLELNYFSFRENTAESALIYCKAQEYLSVSYSNVDHPSDLVGHQESGNLSFTSCYFSGAVPSFSNTGCYSWSFTSINAHGTDTFLCPVTHTRSASQSPTRSQSTISQSLSRSESPGWPRLPTAEFSASRLWTASGVFGTSAGLAMSAARGFSRSDNLEAKPTATLTAAIGYVRVKGHVWIIETFVFVTTMVDPPFRA